MIIGKRAKSGAIWWQYLYLASADSLALFSHSLPSFWKPIYSLSTKPGNATSLLRHNVSDRMSDARGATHVGLWLLLVKTGIDQCNRSAALFTGNRRYNCSRPWVWVECKWRIVMWIVVCVYVLYQETRLLFSLLAILDYVGQQTLHKGTWLIFSHWHIHIYIQTPDLGL